MSPFSLFCCLSCGRVMSWPIVKLKIIDVDMTVSLSVAHNAPWTLIDVDADNTTCPSPNWHCNTKINDSMGLRPTRLKAQGLCLSSSSECPLFCALGLFNCGLNGHFVVSHYLYYTPCHCYIHIYIYFVHYTPLSDPSHSPLYAIRAWGWPQPLHLSLIC